MQLLELWQIAKLVLKQSVFVCEIFFLSVLKSVFFSLFTFPVLHWTSIMTGEPCQLIWGMRLLLAFILVKK